MMLATRLTRQIWVMLAVCWLFPAGVKAREGSSAGVYGKWEEISERELQLVASDLPGAPPAVILFDRRVMDHRLKMERRYVRLKILGREGLDRATVEIPMIDHAILPNPAGRIFGIRARIVGPTGEVRPFDGQVYDRLVIKDGFSRISIKTFVLPGAEVGSIVEYQFVRRIGRGMLPVGGWLLQGDIPVEHALLRVLGAWRSDIEWSNNLATHTDTGARVVLSDIPFRGRYTAEVLAIPAAPDEPQMPPEVTTRLGLSYVLANKHGTALRPEMVWGNAANHLAQLLTKGLEDIEDLQAEAERIAPATLETGPRLRALYAAVQEMALAEARAAEPSRSEERLLRVLANGRGTDLDLTLLFVGLARAAGLKAELVIVGDRGAGDFDNSRLSDLDQGDLTSTWPLNHPLALVSLPSRRLLLDPASAYCAFGFLPWRHTGAHGFVLGSPAAPLTTPVFAAKETTIKRIATLDAIPGHPLTSEERVTWTGHAAHELRLLGVRGDQTSRKRVMSERLQEMFPDARQVDIKALEAWDDPAAPLAVTARLTWGQALPEDVDLYVIQLASLMGTRGTPPTQEARETALVFDYPERSIDEFTLTLGEGLTVRALPDSTTTSTPFERYQLDVTELDGVVKVRREEAREATRIERAAYGVFREFHEILTTTDTSFLVLEDTHAP